MVRLQFNLLPSVATSATFRLGLLLWQVQTFDGLHECLCLEGVSLGGALFLLCLMDALHGCRLLFRFFLVDVRQATRDT